MNNTKQTILIIDDDSRNIFALSAILKAKGFFTRAASGMKEAFALLQNDASVAVLLLDMMMPDMDGYEAIDRLKAADDYRHLPVIAVTAQAMTGDRERCLAAGADAYVSKPVDIDLLVGLLKKYVQ